MGKQKKIPKPGETPSPQKQPEILPGNDPEEPVLPVEPDFVPNEDPFETPPPYEVPPPGEGPQ